MKRKIVFVFLVCLFPLLSPASETEDLRKKVDGYLIQVERQPDWLYSRLAMFWKTHATDVYIKGETFDHIGGKRALYPTVKFNGTRSTETQYHAPKLEDAIPYDDDAEGNITFVNDRTGKMEKVSPAKTGCTIASYNQYILGIAKDAARLYQLTGDKRYAKMAFGVFDVFMKGIYGRNVPIDLNHGHQQTLVGMTTFEVIHEDAITDVTEIYSLLGKYITHDRELYEAALKKWAECEIANGVPHNNWDLIQARYILKIALVLQDDDKYADHRGKQYYLDYIVNQNSLRQWGLKQLAAFGFDQNTYIWYESPGYSVNVVGDFTEFANTLDKQTGIDLFNQIPELLRAVLATPQYLFPNRMIAGFGDTHPSFLSTRAVDQVLDYASRHHDDRLLAQMDSLRTAILPNASPAQIGKYVTPMFYSPNVSWLVQRSGMDKQHDLMISLNGSLGNHQHANGISMELYGKGYVLGPDAGIGKYLYSGLDYAEYYSQFPAHNTVCVDGISSYPVMMSNHAFHVIDQGGQAGKTYSVVSFLEPESNARQQRTNAIVKTSDKGGYYVDIFRSRKIEGGDKTHDYFYHNLGQTMSVTRADGSTLKMRPTQELAFAGGHLYAYSYLYHQQVAEEPGDVKATFVTQTADSSIVMNLWMKGDRNRKIIQALAPENMEYERMPHQPYAIEKQPVLTFIARQRGEAWTYPFIAIFEPVTDKEPSEIASVGYFKPKSTDPAAVGIIVKLKNGRTDYIFSSAEGSEMTYQDMTVKGYYKVITK